MLFTITVIKLLLLFLVLIHFIIIRPQTINKTRNDIIFNSYRIDSTSSHCCISASCPCLVVDFLVNVTSNVSIYLTTNVELSSAIQLTHLKNIAIIGYNNPTVQCGYSGGLHFVSCHNVTIKGITWDQCGTNISVTPGAGIYIHKSSHINFHSCNFQNS